MYIFHESRILRKILFDFITQLVYYIIDEVITLDNLKKLRLEKGLNMKQVASAMNLPYTTYVSYEKGDREPNADMLIKFADFYCTTVDYIINKPDALKISENFISENIAPVAETKLIPLVGTIACGTPIFAEENIESTVAVPQHMNVNFALRCKGDSMVGARILDNDIVCIRQQEVVENGEIAAVLIDNEATLKRFYRYGDTVVLRAENPNFKEIEFSKDELQEIKILGKAVYFISSIN